MAAKKRGQTKKRGKAKARRETASQSVDQRLIKALGHPLRVQILTILNDRMASPNQLSKEMDEGLSQVSYHVKVLRDFDCIEMVKTEPRRGAVEHFYKAKDEVLIPSWTMKLLPKSAQRAVFGEVLGDIEHDVAKSLETGTFDKRPDCVIGRDPRNLDAKAREGAEELAAETFEKYRMLEVESHRRVANGESDELIPTTAVVLIFGSAVGKKAKSRKAKKRKSRGVEAMPRSGPKSEGYPSSSASLSLRSRSRRERSTLSSFPCASSSKRSQSAAISSSSSRSAIAAAFRSSSDASGATRSSTPS